MGANVGYAADFLKKNDRTRYNATLFLPESARVGVQALYAFNADVAQVRDKVSEPVPGEIRLQWWVDLLEGAEHGAADQNPIAEALLHTINQYDLPTGPLRRLLAARRFDLYDDPMPDVATFEGYAGETNSILYQFATMIINSGNDAGAAEAAGHMGVAHAYIGHLLSFGHTAGRGQIMLPQSIFTANGVNENDIFTRQPTVQIQASCAQLREIATDHLNTAEAELRALGSAVRLSFVQISLLRERLARLNQFSSIPFAAPPQTAHWQNLAKMAWWAYNSGRR